VYVVVVVVDDIDVNGDVNLAACSRLGSRRLA
jgi:hypothetical protein